MLLMEGFFMRTRTIGALPLNNMRKREMRKHPPKNGFGRPRLMFGSRRKNVSFRDCGKLTDFMSVGVALRLHRGVVRQENFVPMAASS